MTVGSAASRRCMTIPVRCKIDVSRAARPRRSGGRPHQISCRTHLNGERLSGRWRPSANPRPSHAAPHRRPSAARQYPTVPRQRSSPSSARPATGRRPGGSTAPGAGELCVHVADDEPRAASQDLFKTGLHLFGVGLEYPRLNPSTDGAVLLRDARLTVEPRPTEPLELASASARTRVIAAGDSHRAQTYEPHRSRPPAPRRARPAASRDSLALPAGRGPRCQRRTGPRRG
jgi:hypothetical protein